MKLSLLGLFLIVFALHSNTQRTIGIKLYQNTDIFTVKYSSSIDPEFGSTEHVSNFSRISVAVVMNTARKWNHELELFIPEIEKATADVQFPMEYAFRQYPTYDVNVSTYAFRYELSKSFSSSSRRFYFSLGAAVNPHHVLIENIPNVSNWYYRSVRTLGVSLNVVPRASYKLSERFTLEANIPLKIYDMRNWKQRINNPAIPISQRNPQERIAFSSRNHKQLGLG